MRKFGIPYIPYRSLLLSTTVLNDIYHIYIYIYHIYIYISYIYIYIYIYIIYIYIIYIYIYIYHIYIYHIYTYISYIYIYIIYIYIIYIYIIYIYIIYIYHIYIYHTYIYIHIYHIYIYIYIYIYISYIYIYIRYSSKVTSHSLDILERMSRACRARVEQTYLSILTAHRSRNRSDNRELRHRIQLCRQILSASVISSFESSISCTCSILDTTLETKLIAITLEG